VQAWNIVPKINEVDAHMSPDREDRIVEIHPECSFLAMNEHQPLASKHNAVGREQRTTLVGQLFGASLHGVSVRTLKGARLDDVLDAYAVLWSTERFARGAHRTFPAGEPERDRGIMH
jgi:predicted RNase H-like nuclease